MTATSYRATIAGEVDAVRLQIRTKQGEMWREGGHRAALNGKACRVTGHLVVHDSGGRDEVRADLGYPARSFDTKGELRSWAERRCAEWAREHDSSGLTGTLWLLPASRKFPSSGLDGSAQNKAALAYLRETGLRNAVDDARKTPGRP